MKGQTVPNDFRNVADKPTRDHFIEKTNLPQITECLLLRSGFTLEIAVDVASSNMRTVRTDLAEIKINTGGSGQIVPLQDGPMKM